MFKPARSRGSFSGGWARILSENREEDKQVAPGHIVVQVTRHEFPDRGYVCVFGKEIPGIATNQVYSISTYHGLNGPFFVRAHADCLVKGGRSISILPEVAEMIGLRDKEVTLKPVPEEEATLTSVVMVLNNRYMSKRDVWHMHMAMMQEGGQLLFKGFTHNLKQHIPHSRIESLKNGAGEVASGLVGTQTEICFRSGSTNMFVLVQVSAELFAYGLAGRPYWNHLLECFRDVVNGSLRVTKNDVGGGHYIRMIMFCRTKPKQTWDGRNAMAANTPGPKADAPTAAGAGATTSAPTPAASSSEGDGSIDYYDVFYEGLARAMPPTTALLDRVRQVCISLAEDRCGKRAEMAPARKRVITTDKPRANFTVGSDGWNGIKASDIVEAADGNTLECLNLVLDHFDQHHLDRMLHVCGQSVVMLTAGNGLIKVNDPDLYRLTHLRFSDAGLVGPTSIKSGVQMISVRQAPLHVAPFVQWPRGAEAANTTDKESKTGTLPPRPPWLALAFYPEVSFCPCPPKGDWVRSSLLPVQTLSLQRTEPQLLFMPSWNEAERNVISKQGLSPEKDHEAKDFANQPSQAASVLDDQKYPDVHMTSGTDVMGGHPEQGGGSGGSRGSASKTPEVQPQPHHQEQQQQQPQDQLEQPHQQAAGEQSGDGGGSPSQGTEDARNDDGMPATECGMEWDVLEHENAPWQMDHEGKDHHSASAIEGLLKDLKAPRLRSYLTTSSNRSRNVSRGQLRGPYDLAPARFGDATDLEEKISLMSDLIGIRLAVLGATKISSALQRDVSEPSKVVFDLGAMVSSGRVQKSNSRHVLWPRLDSNPAQAAPLVDDPWVLHGHLVPEQMRHLKICAASGREWILNASQPDVVQVTHRDPGKRDHIKYRYQKFYVRHNIVRRRPLSTSKDKDGSNVIEGEDCLEEATSSGLGITSCDAWTPCQRIFHLQDSIYWNELDAILAGSLPVPPALPYPVARDKDKARSADQAAGWKLRSALKQHLLVLVPNQLQHRSHEKLFTHTLSALEDGIELGTDPFEVMGRAAGHSFNPEWCPNRQVLLDNFEKFKLGLEKLCSGREGTKLKLDVNIDDVGGSFLVRRGNCTVKVRDMSLETSFEKSRDWFELFYDDNYSPPKMFHLVIQWIACSSQHMVGFHQSLSKTAQENGFSLVRLPIAQLFPQPAPAWVWGANREDQETNFDRLSFYPRRVLKLEAGLDDHGKKALYGRILSAWVKDPLNFLFIFSSKTSEFKAEAWDPAAQQKEDKSKENAAVFQRLKGWVLGSQDGAVLVALREDVIYWYESWLPFSDAMDFVEVEAHQRKLDNLRTLFHQETRSALEADRPVTSCSAAAGPVLSQESLQKGPVVPEGPVCADTPMSMATPEEDSPDNRDRGTRISSPELEFSRQSQLSNESVVEQRGVPVSSMSSTLSATMQDFKDKIGSAFRGSSS